MRALLLNTAGTVVVVAAVWLLTVAAMFATVLVTVAFDLDPTFAHWCADVLEAILQIDESVMDNAHRFIRKEK